MTALIGQDYQTRQIPGEVICNAPFCLPLVSECIAKVQMLLLDSVVMSRFYEQSSGT